MIKAMLNAQFGEAFMKGVTGVLIINYTEASQETCLALRKEFDVFKSMLEEFNIGKENGLDNSGDIRSFASISEKDKTISDFVIVIESKDLKTMMYMAGKIKIE